MNKDSIEAQLLSRALSLQQFCNVYGIGRTMAYAEIKQGHLRAVKVGQRTLIPVDAAEVWLSQRPIAKISPERRKPGTKGDVVEGG